MLDARFVTSGVSFLSRRRSRISRLPIVGRLARPAGEDNEQSEDGVLANIGGEDAVEMEGLFPRLRHNEIALMFSGGVDSTATAVQLARSYHRVHLLTYSNGYGHYGFERTARRVRELNRRLDNRFVFHLVSTREYFDRMLVDSVHSDYRAYGSGFVWCMGCKLTMHLRSALYCLEKGLVFMSDGSNSDTSEMVEQSLLSLSLTRFFYEDHSIEFGAPVYNVSREESRRLIAEMGLRMGAQVMDRQVAIQPTCIAGELYYMPYLLLNKRVKHDEAQVGEFIRAKTALASSIIGESLNRRGWQLDELLKHRREQLASASWVEEVRGWQEE